MKFTAKRRDNNQWISGSLIEQNDGTAQIFCYDKHGVSGAHEVIPETVGMYSELPDKHGNMLYKGAIVLLPDTETESVDVGIGYVPVAQQDVCTFAVVDFKNGSFGFQIAKRGENWEKGWTPFPCTDYTGGPDYAITELSEKMEIIGNVFDNPEYLEA